MRGDGVNWTSCGDHLAVYTCIKSCCTPKNNTMLYINHTSMKLEETKEKPGRNEAEVFPQVFKRLSSPFSPCLLLPRTWSIPLYPPHPALSILLEKDPGIVTFDGLFPSMSTLVPLLCLRFPISLPLETLSFDSPWKTFLWYWGPSTNKMCKTERDKSAFVTITPSPWCTVVRMRTSGNKGRIWPYCWTSLDRNWGRCWLAVGLEQVAFSWWAKGGGDTDLDGFWWGLEMTQADTWQTATGIDLPLPLLEGPLQPPV